VAVRQAALAERKAAHARRAETFKVCAEGYHAANAGRWRNKKHRDEWLSAVRRLAYPVLGSMPLGDIDSAHVCKVLAPLLGRSSGSFLSRHYLDASAALSVG
jgi:hypothetical protein